MFKLNEIVHDDLTNTKAIIIKIETSQNNIVGYFIDNDYLGGGRHPWELTKVK